MMNHLPQTVAAIMNPDDNAFYFLLVAGFSACAIWRFANISAKLHQATKDQIDVAASRLKVAEEQLDHERTEAKRQIENAIRAHRPDFQWAQGEMSNRKGVVLRIHNIGGSFFDVSAPTDNPGMINLFSRKFIADRDESDFEIVSLLSEEITTPIIWSITGTTRIGERIEYRFRLSKFGDLPELIEAKLLRGVEGSPTV